MLRDLVSGKDAQAMAAMDVIAEAGADVLLLTDVDWDLEGKGIAALIRGLGERGIDYPFHIALRPNSGIPSGFDLDGNERLGEGRDALGYGRFTGDSGMALLSRLPLGPVDDRSALLWDGRSDAARTVLPEGAEAVVPLATIGQWIVPVEVGGTTLTLLTMNASTPVFDGPEDRNGLRNRDELEYVAELAETVPNPVVLGRGNIDPLDGVADLGAMAALLSHPALQDPEPRGAGGGGEGHRGDPALDTMNWDGPGPLRVDYVLPARTLEVTDAGVIWPAADDPMAGTVEEAGRGRLVWVDIAVP